MKKLAPLSMTVLLLLAIFVLGSGAVVRGDDPAWGGGALYESQLGATNLLSNGSMEEQPYYWMYPNHYVAIDWYRWWIHGSVLPEFDDTREARPHYDGEHAQVYHKWGSTYTAGIYQTVEGLIPCTFYELGAWSRTHSLSGVLPHAKVGFDPLGIVFTTDGAVKNGLPASTVWSAEQTALSVWQRLTAVAEVPGSRATAILYAHPQPLPDGRTYYYDSLWDAATLVKTNPPGGRLPGPSTLSNDGLISNVATSVITSAQGITLTVTWNTSALASTQVWYTVYVSSTTAFTPPLVYLPVMNRNYDVSQGITLPNYSSTPVDQTPVTSHTATFGTFQDGQTIRFVALSRRAIGGVCRTSASGLVDVTLNVGP